MLKRDEPEKNKWLEGCKKEINDFVSRKVWEHIKISDVRMGRELLGTKWVFKVKRCGRYRSRLVVLGYAQIPGVDYTDNFSPVVHDVTLRIAIIFWMILDLDVGQLDVETAFLEGILKPTEYVYLKCPDGYNLEDDECLKVMKGMYGLCQSSRAFWFRISSFLTSPEVGMKQSSTDQCLFVKHSDNGLSVLLLYVDDSAIFAKKEDVEWLFDKIKTQFSIKTEHVLNDFLGCEILRDYDKDECWLLQPHLIKKLVSTFDEEET